jgi:hypothetical protein
MRTDSRVVIRFWLQAIVALLALTFSATALRAQTTREKSSPNAEVALVVVYDTSGSMRGTIQSAQGRPEAKHQIARRALLTVADRLEKFTAAPNDPARPARILDFGLYVFDERQPAVALPLTTFSATTLRQWAHAQKLPADATPLGLTLLQAGQALLSSSASHKHLLVLTDGKNSTGITPQHALQALQRHAEQTQTSFFVHVIAIDIKPEVFRALQKQGATLIGAADEKQLQTQLDFILENQILLEAP